MSTGGNSNAIGRILDDAVFDDVGRRQDARELQTKGTRTVPNAKNIMPIRVLRFARMLTMMAVALAIATAGTSTSGPKKLDGKVMDARHSPVEHVHLAEFAWRDVRRFEISVDDPSRMRECDGQAQAR